MIDCNNIKKFTYLFIFLTCIVSFATKAGIESVISMVES